MASDCGTGFKTTGARGLFGKRQHGMVNFKLANMVEDMKTLETTQALAQQLVPG